MIDWDALVIAPCMDVFGEDLKPVYTRAAGGVPFEVVGVFDDAYDTLVLNAESGEPEMATIQPVIGVRLSQFVAAQVAAGLTPQPLPLQSDRLAIPRISKTYLVTNVQPDGKGWAFLSLNLADG